MNRIIQDIEPAYPWLWMAVLTSNDNISSVLDLSGSSTGLAAATSWASKALSTLKSGGLGSFLTSDLDSSSAFSGLMQSINLPPLGFNVQYEDLGFIKYPTVGSIILDPITTEFVETSDQIVSRYFMDWLNEICPTVTSFRSKGLSADAVTTLNKASLFAPLDTKARSLYIIKTKRSVFTAALNSILDKIQSGTFGSLMDLRSGIYELPVQIFCFPKVVPLKVIEPKLDKSETNSIRSIQVIFERVPTLLYSDNNDESLRMAANKTQATLNATLTFSRIADAASSALAGIASSVNNVVSKASFVSKIYTRDTASELVDKSSQAED